MRKDVFVNMPDVKFNRSKFSLDHGVKSTMNAGFLYPLDVQEVLPGDTFKCHTEAVLRVSSAYLKPVIDNAFLELYHFFVPLRLVQTDADKIFGSSSPMAYQSNMLSKAAVFSTGQTVVSKSVGDYLGLPVGRIPKDVSVLPFRAFAKIYNDWFRNQSISYEVVYSMYNTAQSSEALNGNSWGPMNYTGMCPKVAKKRDYFTACLPSPQKGAGVDLPLGTVAKLKTGNEYSLGIGNYIKYGPHSDTNYHGVYAAPPAGTTEAPTLMLDTNVNSHTALTGQYYTNIYADLSNATAATVNDLRTAFALQKMLEKDARYGSDYRSYLRGHFGVVSPDARLQYSEYLGGGSIPINVQQVAQTSNSSTDPDSTQTPQGNVAGYSWSNGYSKYSKGFVEHGYVFTVGCIRYKHTYSQGVPKMFMRKDRADFYDPLFANLGEQPVYRSEIFAASETDVKGAIFGYNEAWAEYRYAPNRCSGLMRPNVSNSLAIWHYGDNYSGYPSLNESFILETPTNIDRTLAVESSELDQFIIDLWFDCKAVRVMPAYSVPGLIDHH